MPITHAILSGLSLHRGSEFKKSPHQIWNTVLDFGLSAWHYADDAVAARLLRDEFGGAAVAVIVLGDRRRLDDAAVAVLAVIIVVAVVAPADGREV